MNKKVKTLWLKALRSRDYKQGKNGLHRKDREGNEMFCCLGVLCDLHAKAHNLKWTQSRECGSLYFTYRKSSGYLPKAVREWAGLKDDRGTIYNKDGKTVKTTLARMNDAIGSSFSQVAKAIEKHF